MHDDDRRGHLRNGKLTLTQALLLPERTPVTVIIRNGEPGSDAERAAWLKLSEESLAKTWDNLDDDAFNELLTK